MSRSCVFEGTVAANSEHTILKILAETHGEGPSTLQAPRTVGILPQPEKK